MRSVRKIIALLILICSLSFGGLVVAAKAESTSQQINATSAITNEQVISDLNSQLSLLKWGAGTIVAALCGAIGLLYRTLTDAHDKMIIILEKESTARLEIVEKMTTSLSSVSNSLEEFGNKLSDVNRRLESLYLDRSKTSS